MGKTSFDIDAPERMKLAMSDQSAQESLGFDDEDDDFEDIDEDDEDDDDHFDDVRD